MHLFSQSFLKESIFLNHQVMKMVLDQFFAWKNLVWNVASVTFPESDFDKISYYFGVRSVPIRWSIDDFVVSHVRFSASNAVC
jgi:hypothetical protein